MCVACNNPYHDCLIHSEVEKEEECNCTEGVIFYINGKEVSEEVYNNHTIDSEKRYEHCKKCN